MSRSNYTEEPENQWGWIRYRGAVNSAIKGARGQKTLREILAALDVMPEKRLAANSLVTPNGEYCTLGVLGAKRGIDLEKLDPEDSDAVAEAFGIAPALAREIVFENDEAAYWCENPQARWRRMRDWVERNIVGDDSLPPRCRQIRMHE